MATEYGIYQGKGTLKITSHVEEVQVYGDRTTVQDFPMKTRYTAEFYAETGAVVRFELLPVGNVMFSALMHNEG